MLVVDVDSFEAMINPIFVRAIRLAKLYKLAPTKRSRAAAAWGIEACDEVPTELTVVGKGI